MNIMTLSIMSLSIMTLSIMTLSIMTLTIMTLSIMTQHNTFSLTLTVSSVLVAMLSVIGLCCGFYHMVL
jgi:hypothetical protein